MVWREDGKLARPRTLQELLSEETETKLQGQDWSCGKARIYNSGQKLNEAQKCYILHFLKNTQLKFGNRVGREESSPMGP